MQKKNINMQDNHVYMQDKYLLWANYKFVDLNTSTVVGTQSFYGLQGPTHFVLYLFFTLFVLSCQHISVKCSYLCSIFVVF